MTLCGAAEAPAAPAFSIEPQINCAIYAAALADPLFKLEGEPLRVVNHASRRPSVSPPDSPLPTGRMAARAQPPWTEPAETYAMLLTGPAQPGFLSVSCSWRRLGLNLTSTSRDEGTRLTLSLPVLTADRMHALVYVQVETGMADAEKGWTWNAYVCAAGRDAQGWRGDGCVPHADAIYF